MSTEDFVKGAIYGHLVGDAIGFPLKNIPVLPKRLDMYETTNFRKGTYSDASAMMLCTIAAINDCRSVSAEDIMDKLQDWYVGGYLTVDGDCIEIKSNVIQALTNYTNGFPPDRCGIGDVDQNNNAALIRTLPIALFYCHKAIDDLIENIHLIAKLTNTQLDNQVCCVLYGLFIRNLLLGKKEKVIPLLEDYYKTKKQLNRASTLETVAKWYSKEKVRGTEQVIDSLWSSWASCAQQDDFSGCIKTAIELGGSRDDTASLAGALAGTIYGFQNIPESWINNLLLNFEVIDEINKFVALVKR